MQNGHLAGNNKHHQRGHLIYASNSLESENDPDWQTNNLMKDKKRNGTHPNGISAETGIKLISANADVLVASNENALLKCLLNFWLFIEANCELNKLSNMVGEMKRIYQRFGQN